MSDDDFSTNPYYKTQEERIADLEAEVKELKRKIDNLIRNEGRRWGVPEYGKNVKLPKIPRVKSNYD